MSTTTSLRKRTYSRTARGVSSSPPRQRVVKKKKPSPPSSYKRPRNSAEEEEEEMGNKTKKTKKKKRPSKSTKVVSRLSSSGERRSLKTDKKNQEVKITTSENITSPPLLLAAQPRASTINESSMSSHKQSGPHGGWIKSYTAYFQRRYVAKNPRSTGTTSSAAMHDVKDVSHHASDWLRCVLFVCVSLVVCVLFLAGYAFVQRDNPSVHLQQLLVKLHLCQRGPIPKTIGVGSIDRAIQDIMPRFALRYVPQHSIANDWFCRKLMQRPSTGPPPVLVLSVPSGEMATQLEGKLLQQLEGAYATFQNRTRSLACSRDTLAADVADMLHISLSDNAPRVVILRNVSSLTSEAIRSIHGALGDADAAWTQHILLVASFHLSPQEFAADACGIKAHIQGSPFGARGKALLNRFTSPPCVSLK